MMQTLVRMALLVVETSGRGRYMRQYITGTDKFDEAWERAKGFVGEHNEVDGLSTKPEKGKSGETHWIRRSDSFGVRKVEITPIPWLEEE